jgi:Rps23 Pro-64 3,4-dihydroxylase Tpa1-like proline 4-hydroxylase
MHAIIENFCAPALLSAVAATWPRDDWPHWHRYDDKDAVKLGSKDAHRLPDAARLVLAEMARIRIPAGLPEAFPDLDLHGAGLHAILPGGHLGLHLDGAVHPLTGWRRELNAVLFVDDWEPHWGGELEFWQSQTSGAATVIHPVRNSLVLFATGADAWHRVAQVTGPNPRRTLSMFWWSNLPTDCRRTRAEFHAIEDRQFRGPNDETN